MHDASSGSEIEGKCGAAGRIKEENGDRAAGNAKPRKRTPAENEERRYRDQNGAAGAGDQRRNRHIAGAADHVGERIEQPDQNGTGKNHAGIGVGGGEPSRVGALDLALKKAKKTPRGAVLASDGFFPKDDSIKLAHRRGIKAIIQPGGSIRDEEIIAACNKFKIAMVFTGLRHFSH